MHLRIGCHHLRHLIALNPLSPDFILGGDEESFGRSIVEAEMDFPHWWVLASRVSFFPVQNFLVIGVNSCLVFISVDCYQIRKLEVLFDWFNRDENFICATLGPWRAYFLDRDFLILDLDLFISREWQLVCFLVVQEKVVKHLVSFSNVIAPNLVNELAAELMMEVFRA